jgi:DNA-binding phage protein
MESEKIEPVADSDFKTDLLEKLKDPHYAVAYLAACIEEGDDVLRLALRDVAEVWGGA